MPGADNAQSGSSALTPQEQLPGAQLQELHVQEALPQPLMMSEISVKDFVSYDKMACSVLDFLSSDSREPGLIVSCTVRSEVEW